MDRFSHYPLDINADHTVPAIAYLGDELWDAFRAFGKAFLIRRYDDFVKEFRLPDALRGATEKFFGDIREIPNTTGLEQGLMTDLYFDNFSAIIPLRDPRAVVVWKQLFQFVYGWEKKNMFLLHKGTLFYCWATAHVLSGDYPNAFVLIHRALEEDNRRFGSTAVLPTATHRFISMHPKPDDTLYPMTLEMVRFVVEALERYRREANGKLTYADFQKRFFDEQHEILEDLQFFFLFSVVNFLKLRDVYETEGLSDTRMAPMIFSNTIAGLIVIGEELFRLVLQTTEQNNKSLTFINFMQDIAYAEGWTTERQHYHATISNAHLNRENFAEMVQDILHGTYRTKDNRQLELMETHLVLTYQLRNFSAHTMQSQEVLWKRFPEILQSVLNTIFFGVEKLAEKASLTTEQ